MGGSQVTSAGEAGEEPSAQKIARILSGAERGERRCAWIGLTAGLLALAGVALALYASQFVPRDPGEWTGVAVGGFVFSVLVGFSCFWVGCCILESKIRRRYLEAFPWLDERRKANRLLATEVSSVFPLARLRRKLGVTVSRFRCSVCGAKVRVHRIGQIVQCPRCRVMVRVPPVELCPKCGSSHVRLIRPEEQLAPADSHHDWKIGGCLAGGPLGLLAGAVLDDAANRTRSRRRTAKVCKAHSLYYCERCHMKWGTTLDPACRAEQSR